MEGVGIIKEIYWAVPDHYTIGEIFAANEHAGACKAAKAKIRPIDYRMLAPQEDGTHFGWTRAFLDQRFKIEWTDHERAGVPSVEHGTDMSVHRSEIKLTETEKRAKLEEKGWA